MADIHRVDKDGLVSTGALLRTAFSIQASFSLRERQQCMHGKGHLRTVSEGNAGV